MSLTEYSIGYVDSIEQTIDPDTWDRAGENKAPTLANRGLSWLVLLTHQELDVGHAISTE